MYGQSLDQGTVISIHQREQPQDGRRCPASPQEIAYRWIPFKRCWRRDLGYSKIEKTENSDQNRRNGHTTKKIRSEYGEMDLTIPRD